MKRWLGLLMLLSLAFPALAIDGPVAQILNKHIGKETVVLSFFTSWSKTCQKELAFLDQLEEKKGLKIIGVSFDRKEKELAAFIKENKIGLEIVHDQKLSTIKDYKILIIPTLVIIDKQGTIIKTYIDFDENVEKSVIQDLKTLLVP